MNLMDALPTFIAECRDLLASQEEALLRLESEPNDGEAVNAVFRAAHTIKGTAGLFGLAGIVEFTHKMETVLDRVRDGRLTADADMVALLLACGDHIGQLVDKVAQGGIDAVGREDDGGLGQRLERYLPPQAAPAEPPRAAEGVWHIVVRFGPDLFRNGMDPLGFVHYLGELGEVVAIAPLCEQVPRVRDLDPESCHLGFDLALRSGADKQTLVDAFEFVKDDAEITILAPESRIADIVDLIHSMPDEYARIGEILVASGAVTEQELARALEDQVQCSSPATARVGEILVERQAVPTAVVAAAAAKQQAARRQAENRYIRIEAAKLDHLINLVGELVVSGAAASLRAQALGDAAMLESTAVVAQTVEQIRDSALKLRMVPIGDTFSRFKRIVHDVSRELGKSIDLVIDGGETELDKTVIDKIGDPLTHLIRNAVDHGIEPPAEREARGKPAVGTVRLNAYHDSGSIVIEVADDGGGIDRARVLAKAIEKGIVEPGMALGEQEIDDLIFAAGLSTAKQVSDLSGRGVGMDVVRRNIEALRGTVDVRAVAGGGTTMRVRLPLTLAIIDGFLLKVGDGFFVVPLDMVEECLAFIGDHRSGNRRDLINLRGEVLPYLVLREVFGCPVGHDGRENIVVVEHGGRKVGLVVDQLLGEMQTVIKPLGRVFERLAGVSGATILGSGEVAVILDIPQLVQMASAKERRVGRDAALPRTAERV